MVENDVQDELAEGFEPTSLPAPGPDGALTLPPMQRARHPHPRLCEAGPCRHYHRMEIQMDVQDPRAVRAPDGSVNEPVKLFHVETHHYCYPDVGIETKLGALPVISCNRWDPMPVHVIDNLNKATDEWLETTEPGKKFSAELEAWRTEREAELKAEEEAAAQAAEDLAAMADGAEPAPERLPGVRLVIELASSPDLKPGQGAWTRVETTAAWDQTVASVIRDAFGPRDDFHVHMHIHMKGAPDKNIPLVDLERTLAQVGLSDGDHLVLTRKPDLDKSAPVDLGGEAGGA